MKRAELAGPVFLDGARFRLEGELPIEYAVPTVRCGLIVTNEIFLRSLRITQSGHRVYNWVFRETEEIQSGQIEVIDQVINWWKNKVSGVIPD